MTQSTIDLASTYNYVLFYGCVSDTIIVENSNPIPVLTLPAGGLTLQVRIRAPGYLLCVCV